ncbi:UbiA family prenyltransferase [Nocardia sp. IFM 10818]
MRSSENAGGDGAVLTTADFPQSPSAAGFAAGRNLLLSFHEARPCVQVLFVLRFLGGGILCGAPHLDARFLIGCLAWFFAIMCAYLLNGCSDLVADRINGSTRPLATGRLRRSSALRIAAALALMSVGLSALVSINLLLHAIGALVLGCVYSFGRNALKRGPFGVTVTVVVIGLLTFDAGRIACEGGLTVEFVAFAGGLTLWMVVGGLVKDLDELPGDLAAGRRPFFACVGYLKGCVTVGFIAAVPTGGMTYLSVTTDLPVDAAAAALIVGSIGLWHRLWRGSWLYTARGRRGPYRMFMHTQYVAYLGCAAELVAAWKDPNSIVSLGN